MLQIPALMQLSRTARCISLSLTRIFPSSRLLHTVYVFSFILQWKVFFVHAWTHGSVRDFLILSPAAHLSFSHRSEKRNISITKRRKTALLIFVERPPRFIRWLAKEFLRSCSNRRIYLGYLPQSKKTHGWERAQIMTLEPLIDHTFLPWARGRFENLTHRNRDSWALADAKTGPVDDPAVAMEKTYAELSEQ